MLKSDFFDPKKPLVQSKCFAAAETLFPVYQSAPLFSLLPCDFGFNAVFFGAERNLLRLIIRRQSPGIAWCLFCKSFEGLLCDLIWQSLCDSTGPSTFHLFCLEGFDHFLRFLCTNAPLNTWLKNYFRKKGFSMSHK